MIDARTLREIAARLYNYDAYLLIDAGVLIADENGHPRKGGSDWERYNLDILTFILKLPDDRLENLARLLGE
jgi:hypothetical protein